MYFVFSFFGLKDVGLSIHEGKNNEKRRNGATVGYSHEEKRKVPVR